MQSRHFNSSVPWAARNNSRVLSHPRGLTLLHGWLILLLTACLLLGRPSADAGEPVYLDNKTLERELKSLAKAHPKMVRVQALAESLDGTKVWLAEVGQGLEEDRRARPALLVVGGIEGHDLAGSAIALHWLQRLMEHGQTNEAVQDLLDRTTVYVVPRLNPDATASFFQKPRRESAVNRRPVDDDHDGWQDEDGPEDLNGDGVISWMRIEDPDGEYILDESEPRLLLKADRVKGERGAWKLLSEGRDNDGDEAWNEDGPGGVNFNRNFPFDYQFFAATAGLHPMSEPETRALADFIVDHRNIAVAFTFGDADNLMQMPKGEDGGKRPPTAVQNNDLPYYRELGLAWREALGLKKELSGNKEPGSFSDWIYFHRGRLSLAARPWSPALQLEQAKEAKPKEKKEGDEAKEPDAEEFKKDGDSKEPEQAAKTEANASDEGKETAKKKPAPAADKRNEEERNVLKWMDEHAPDQFLAWQPFDHPDFPGRKVEIGGFVPFAKSNPPESILPGLADRQADFLTALLGKLPRVGIRKVDLRHLGDSVYDLTVTVENPGYLPTSLAQGETTREVFPTRITLLLDSQAILSGARRVMRNAIPGSGGAEEIRWVFLARNKTDVEVEVVSMLGGTLRQSIPLNK